jgi:hypothetical protein
MYDPVMSNADGISTCHSNPNSWAAPMTSKHSLRPCC